MLHVYSRSLYLYASNDKGGFSLPFLWICLSKIGAYYGPHEGRTGYPIKSTNANPMAYNETVAKALWEASEKVPKNSAEDLLLTFDTPWRLNGWKPKNGRWMEDDFFRSIGRFLGSMFIL